MIKLFQPNFEIDECLQEIRDCMEKGWTGVGYKTIQFEDDWKESMGYSHALFLNSATAGLNLAVKVLGEKYKWNEKTEIISTPLTFVSTNHAIIRNGYKCIFADVDDTFCLSVSSVERTITKNTRAVMYVGYGGCAGNFCEIQELCKKYGLVLIVDASHMAGTRVNNKSKFDADAVIFSFHAVKNLPTGDSGMLCMKEGKLDEKARIMSWLGIDKNTYIRINGDEYSWKYNVEYVGNKYNGNSIMASIGIVQLKYLERDNTKRRSIAEWYNEEFRFIGLNRKIKLQKIPQECLPSRHLFPILVENRNEVIGYLGRKGIQTGVHYQINTDYPMYACETGTCKHAEWISRHEISLPMHVFLNERDIRYIARVLNECVTPLNWRK